MKNMIAKHFTHSTFFHVKRVLAFIREMNEEFYFSTSDI